MAVDRRGVAYVTFTDRLLYRVSTATGACVGTSFQPDQQGFGAFGMGYATNAAGPTESLFVAGTADNQNPGGISPGLARIDTNNFVLTKVGNFVPDIKQAELTGTGDGRLFAFYTKGIQSGPPSYIGEINTTNARVVAETAVPHRRSRSRLGVCVLGRRLLHVHQPGRRVVRRDALPAFGQLGLRRRVAPVEDRRRRRLHLRAGAMSD